MTVSFSKILLYEFSYSFYAKHLRYALTGLTLNILSSVHGVYLCSVCSSEQRGIIFIYAINSSVFVTTTAFVYCAVRAEYLSTVQVE